MTWCGNHFFPGDVCKAEKPCTTSRATYQPPQPTPPGTHYSRLSAVTATFHSSVHFGGTSDTSRTPSVIQREGKDRPPAGRVEGSKVRGQRTRVKRVHRNSSFLPSGDMDVERVRERMSHSTTKKTHQVVSTYFSMPTVLCECTYSHQCMVTHPMWTAPDYTLPLLYILDTTISTHPVPP